MYFFPASYRSLHLQLNFHLQYWQQLTRPTWFTQSKRWHWISHTN